MGTFWKKVKCEMRYIVLILRLMMLMISCYGYVRFLSTKVRVEFAYGIFLSSICSIMFFAGILNILEIIAWGIFVGGIALTVISIRRKWSFRTVLCPGTVFLVLSAIILFAVLHNMIFTHYDDFSHWGTALKVIMEKKRFPNFTDKIIDFQAYPLGSASFIYYFVTITGLKSEWFQMYVQAMYMIGIMTGMYAFAKNWKGWIFSAAVSVVVIMCNNRIFNLLVDTLLPICAFGGVMLCVYYKDEMKRFFWGLIPFLVSVVSIKNSGMLFAVYILTVTLYEIWKSRSRLENWIWIFVCPFATQFLWKRHVMLVFENGLKAKHSMAMVNLVDMFVKKKADDIQTVIDLFINEVISLDNPFLVFLLIIVGLRIFKFRNRDKKDADVGMLGIGVVIFYLIYQVGMLGMYLTSMPISESLRLAGYSRYHCSILIFCGLLISLMTILCCTTEAVRPFVELRRFAVYGIVLCLIAKSLLPPIFPKVSNSIRAELNQIIAEYDIDAEKSYFLILGDDYDQKYSSLVKSGYMGYCMRYLLMSKDVYICNLEQYLAREKGWEGYEYLIAMGEIESLQSVLPEIASCRVIHNQ